MTSTDIYGKTGLGVSQTEVLVLSQLWHLQSADNRTWLLEQLWRNEATHRNPRRGRALTQQIQAAVMRIPSGDREG